MLKKMLVSVLLLGFLFGLPMPVSVGAQGGDTVYKSLGVIGALRVGGTARFEGPVYGVGPQDAASDLLTADVNVMSTTWVTVMSGSVTTRDAGDSVQLHLMGEFGLMNPVYLLGTSVTANTTSTLSRIDDPNDPAGGTMVGFLPSGVQAHALASHSGSLYYIVSQSGTRTLWRIDDLSDPAGAVMVGTLPSGVGSTGMTFKGGSLYIGGSSDPSTLWRFDDLSDLAGGTLVGTFPSGFIARGLAFHDGSLYVLARVSSSSSQLWRAEDPTNPAGATQFASGGSFLYGGLTSYGRSLYLGGSSLIYRIERPEIVSRLVSVGSLPLGSYSSSGMTAVSPMGDCMVRIARGTTEIQSVTFPDHFRFDTQFIDDPPAGTHTYAVQIKTVHPSGCAALLRNGAVPAPSLFVQSYYGGTTP